MVVKFGIPECILWVANVCPSTQWSTKSEPLTDGRVLGMNVPWGCPLWRSHYGGYGAPSMDQQLDAAARRWVATNAYSGAGTTIAVSQIFNWFSDDFRRWEPGENDLLPKEEARAIAFIKAFGAPVDTVFLGHPSRTTGR